MARTESIRCRSWDDFKTSVVTELFGHRPFERGRFIFRGQRSADWRLVPSLNRWLQRAPERDPSEVAAELLGWFRRECEGSAGSDVRWDDEVTVTALAQHYGLPTRLLDWSESPYIATFFAFSDAVGENYCTGEAAIWALDTRMSLWTNSAGVQVVRVTAVGNIRLRNQSGLFTMSTARAASLDEYVAAQPDEEVGLYKFVLPLSEAVLALADLDAMGIHAERVYPGLTGGALSAKMRVALGFHASSEP